ncbi:hypothetical protein Vadar_009651 [Vaccinium darrowii]|uniref:Uncharacterized protein n=1 Tax=Vaccinium darrowii TaxID=229202 RepID=A0ACB7XPF5_9ERIC|nr:hypothetical protein Vadar_009651 [Vaccinium darrowii]
MAILSTEVLLISTGVVSITLMMNCSIPLITHFVLHQIPTIWSTLISLLRPPYHYFIVNGIIITITATSRFHHKLDSKIGSEPLVGASKPPPSDLPCSGYDAVSNLPKVYKSEVVEKSVVLSGHGPVDDVDAVNDGAFDVSRSTWPPPPQGSNLAEVEEEYVLPMTEKPLVSTKFDHRNQKSEKERKKRRRREKEKRRGEKEEVSAATTSGHLHHHVRPPSPPPHFTSASCSVEITRMMRHGYIKAWSLSFGSWGFAQNPVKYSMRSMA